MHAAVATVANRAPLEIIQVPTVDPVENEIQVRVEWTASTPLDLHQSDGGLLVNRDRPQVLGDGTAGTVVGDKVFGFTWREQKEKSHQEFCAAPEYLFGKIPVGFSPQQAVVLGNNFVTVFHAVTTDLGLPLTWPVPTTAPPHAQDTILIWGSPKNHELIKSLGASQVFDYRDPNVDKLILDAFGTIPFILDCIGSKDGSVAPIAKIAKKGSKVAILLPVIVKVASETEEPEFEMDVSKSATWADGVDARGVRTHFYLQNEFFKNELQSTIMPTLLAEGIVKPNNYRIIEGKTLLERAQTALDALRRQEVSAERLVWRVAE